MLVVGATTEAIRVSPVQLMQGRKANQGGFSGTSTDWEDALRFAELTGVRAIVENYPLARAAQAYARSRDS